MSTRNPVLDALAVEALRSAPHVLALAGRACNALETIADAQALRALIAYGESLYPSTSAADAEKAALTAARVMAGRGAARLGKRLALRASAGAAADVAEVPDNDGADAQRDRKRRSRAKGGA